MPSLPEISIEAVVEKLRKRLDEAIWTISIQEVQIEALQTLVEKLQEKDVSLNGDKPST